MDEIVAQLSKQVGIDKATAEKVVAFLKENAHKLPELLGSDIGKSLTDKIPGAKDLLGGLLGGGNK